MKMFILLQIGIILFIIVSLETLRCEKYIKMRKAFSTNVNFDLDL